jgi:hypothetical protein
MKYHNRVAALTGTAILVGGAVGMATAFAWFQFVVRKKL